MKKIPLLMLLFSVFVLTACEEDQTQPDRPIPVVNITIDTPTDTIALTVGGDKTLQAIVMPDNASNKNITWSSDDKTIATVSTTGVVTGIKAGNTKVRAISAENDSIMDECVIAVTDMIIDITEVALDTEKLTVEIDQTKQLTVTVMPENATNRSVTWASSDKTIATVSQTGNVTGHKVGRTTITVIPDADSVKAISCEVIVTEKSIPATDMWMKTTKLELKVGNSKPLDAVTIPINTTDQTMEWSSDDETIATVNTTGVVTGVKAGTTTVWVKWGQDNSIKDKCTVTVLAESSYAVGDLYPDANNPVGVVFWKDPNNPLKGKIVSLTETRTEWAKEKVMRNVSDKDNGMTNMKTVKAIPGWADLYPAFKWCSDIGNDWYLPAISEMKAIYDTKDAINAAIAKTSVEGATGLDNNKDYWTSTERALSPQYSAATIQFYKGFGGGGVPAGGTSFGSKDGENNTRAIMSF